MPVVYANDGNAAALYAYHVHFGVDAMRRSSVAAIVGTGLGGGVAIAALEAVRSGSVAGPLAAGRAGPGPAPSAVRLLRVFDFLTGCAEVRRPPGYRLPALATHSRVNRVSATGEHGQPQSRPKR
ncbi:hypothetical protein [Micromonospora sp. SL4-19]|uniref:hypothetical protein n=1 Tax=Micromonospora sp. SL4-19 TaxID=3399129 RepID=UPI003A4DA9FB